VLVEIATYSSNLIFRENACYFIRVGELHCALWVIHISVSATSTCALLALVLVPFTPTHLYVHASYLPLLFSLSTPPNSRIPKKFVGKTFYSARIRKCGWVCHNLLTSVSVFRKYCSKVAQTCLANKDTPTTVMIRINKCPHDCKMYTCWPVKFSLTFIMSARLSASGTYVLPATVLMRWSICDSN
jgi:hypothetical protein